MRSALRAGAGLVRHGEQPPCRKWKAQKVRRIQEAARPQPGLRILALLLCREGILHDPRPDGRDAHRLKACLRSAGCDRERVRGVLDGNARQLFHAGPHGSGVRVQGGEGSRVTAVQKTGI